MKKIIELEFSELSKNKEVAIELDDSHSPKTVAAIADKLPIKVLINRWGDELYTDAIPVKVGEENAKAVVNLLDVTYWPEGSAVCLFYGSTPISKDKEEIKPYSPVNIIGRITTTISSTDLQEFLKSIEESHIHKKIPVVLR
jgi:hypothetical protein